MVVGFVHLYGYGLGDDFIAMEAIYALKKIYKCKVVLFRVGGAMNRLVKQMDFVDEYYALDGYLSAKSVPIINKYHYDYLIITKSESQIFPLLPKLNARKIIIAAKGINVLLSLLPKYRVVPMRNLLLKKIGLRAQCLNMVRAINPRLYNKSINSLDFSNARVQTTAQHKRFVDEFLAANLQSKNVALILVNPFNITSAFSLSLQGYFEIMRSIVNLNGGGDKMMIAICKNAQDSSHLSSLIQKSIVILCANLKSKATFKTPCLCLKTMMIC